MSLISKFTYGEISKKKSILLYLENRSAFKRNAAKRIIESVENDFAKLIETKKTIF